MVSAITSRTVFVCVCCCQYMSTGGWSFRSAANLAMARPQVRLTAAGTACDAGAHPRGSRCTLGGT